MTSACNKKHGVKNLSIGFIDCENDGATIGPYTHSLFGDEMPMFKLINHKVEGLSGRSGRVKYVDAPMQVKLTVERQLWLSLALYQGGQSFGQCEFYNGIIYTWREGINMSDELSDGNSVVLDLVAERVDEKLFETAPA